MPNSPQLWIIEKLTVSVWLWRLLPVLWRMRVRPRIYFVDSTPAGERLARWMGRRFCVLLGRLDFRFSELRTEDGCLLRFRLTHQDWAEVRDLIAEHQAFQEMIRHERARASSLGLFLSKETLFVRQPHRSPVRLMALIWVAASVDPGHEGRVHVFAYRRLWRRVFEAYARRRGVELHSTGTAPLGLRDLVIEGFGEDRIKALYYRILDSAAGRWWRRCRRSGHSLRMSSGPLGLTAGSGKLWVEYYGQLNLENPQFYSDFFFFPDSGILSSDLLVSFNIPRDPLDRGKWEELHRHGMAAVALNPRSSSVGDVPVFHPRSLRGREWSYDTRARNQEARFLRRKTAEYGRQREYWVDFLTRYGVRLFTSWYKYDARHAVITDALREVGGMATLYQRAFEEFPSVETAVSSDVLFAFSPKQAAIEAASGSRIPYIIVTGYTGDHRFAFLREPAALLRRRLEAAGARRIVAYFDENSSEDQRWSTGHALTQSNYAFLLEQVLFTPSLGLIIKPKVAVTLRRRLGPVAELLRRAEAAGRCFVCESGTLHNSYPPAFAALASDVAIHGHLCAATAGFESALTGTPTLLVDRESWNKSALYQLGRGKVVFNDWPALWQACCAYWQNPSGVPGFGDWSSILSAWDPFRDGRAAQRMGTFLAWLLEGMKAGRSRDRILEEAAQRYAEAWGADKVLTL